MGKIIPHELLKILNNKIVLCLIGLFAPIYFITVYVDYYWHPGMSWERVVAFPYSIGTLYEGIVILLACSGVFTQEYLLQTDSIILSSKQGRAPLVSAKIMAALSFIALIVLGFWMINIAVNISIAGLSGWSLPLQELQGYGESPFSFRVWQYCIVQFLTNLLACIAYGLFILMLSVRSRSILVVFFVGGIVFLLPFFVHNISELSIAWGIKNLFLTEFMRVQNMFNRSRHLNYGGLTVQLHIIFFYVYIVSLAALFIQEIYRCFKKHQPLT